ncbi:heparinase II/III family protein [Mariniflexile sp.]|uniref:heparinase II/III family protein n=1 Tax=Mariniflexile sp. TaxID=1979402 RepID=UPI003567335E
MNWFKLTWLISCFLCFEIGVSQNIPSDSVIETFKLQAYLKPEVQSVLGGVQNISDAELAKYFREKFSERYFYDWKNFNDRFIAYKTAYPEAENSHAERALDHLSKFPDFAQWKLPFNYSNGLPVNAYALRHLARQHKMLDIAFYYNYQNKKDAYLSYFKNQLQSLNKALATNSYETIEDGNGVYEAFRSGYRVLNWLQIHNMFLGEKGYSDKEQLVTIATLLQHASNLYETNASFVPGNHQTRGMSALAMLSILFIDFKDSDKWYERSMQLLEAHLTKEINKDGFQFERSVHYHISDIDNYYYVYQLARNSNMNVDAFWENKLKSLFVTLTKIAYPDKSAPVFSDDTNEPWAEKNNISGALTLGYLLFADLEMGYFANNFVESDMYWYLKDTQLKMLDNIQKKVPEFKSVVFPETGYYIMRQGWNQDDKMMAISNGLDVDKPDHQHGDLLGVQAMSNGQVILPNYQVRYPLKDYEFFKNSLVKNVALVDDELQGKGYAGNQGGSGFGKFSNLPKPKTIAWSSNNNIDVYVGSHDGFENIGVTYTRQVIYLKDDFWVIKDNFKSNESHDYKQIWQGHYTFEKAPNLLRSTFNDGSGCDIYQLVATDDVKTSGTRGKEWSIISKKEKSTFSFITAIVPFKKFDDRIDEDQINPNLKGWKVNDSNWVLSGVKPLSLTKGDLSAFFSIKGLALNNIKASFSEEVDVVIKYSENNFSIQLVSENKVECNLTNNKKLKTVTLNPGQVFTVF